MTVASDLGLNEAQGAHAAAMVAEVQAESLPQRVAVIVVETAMVESSFQIYANPNVAESLSVPHEAVGSDHASVGPLQQQVPSWGSAADCMDPVKSTRKFLHGAGNNPGLLTLPGYRFAYVGYPGAISWAQLPTGSAAQAVQVSAFPDRYQAQEGLAQRIVAAYWSAAHPIPSATTEDPMIIVTAPGAGVATLVPGGKYHLSGSEWAALRDVKSKAPAAFATAVITLAEWNSLAEKRGKL